MFKSLGLSTLLIANFVLTTSAQSFAPQKNPSLVGNMGLGLHSSLYSPVVILRNLQVQKDLNLTEAQMKQLKLAEEEFQRANSHNFEEIQNKKKELGDMPDPQALAAHREFAKASRKAFQQESETAYLKILDRRQRTRLLQIQYQAEGPKAFTRTEVQIRLNLSPAQIEQILAIVDQGDIAMDRASRVLPEVPFEPLRGNEVERRKQMESKKYMTAINQVNDGARKVRLSIMQNIAKVLTKGQRANYERMIGKPFEFAKIWNAPAAPSSTPRENESRNPQQK